MSDRMLALAICNAASVAAVIGASVVAASGHNGWGWLLFFAAASHCTPSKDAPEESSSA